MPTAMPYQPAEPRHTGLLDRIYGYVGAHNSPLRYDYERDRAWHRTAMPAVSIAWIFLYHRFVVGTPVNEAEIAWACGAFLYAIAGLSFWAYLKRRPQGGIHVAGRGQGLVRGNRDERIERPVESPDARQARACQFDR